MKRKSDQWFRFYVRTLNNPKVQRLSAETFKGWVNLICMAAEMGGDLPSVDDAAFRLRMSIGEATELITELKRAGLVDRDNTVHDWEEMQRKSDTSTGRVREFRERQKEIPVGPDHGVVASAFGQAIFDHWNGLTGLTTHRQLTPEIQKSIRARLNGGAMSEADICRAITRYAELCQSKKAPGHNQWGLSELLSRSDGAWIDKMLDPKYEGIRNGSHKAEDRLKHNLEVAGLDDTFVSGGDM